MSKVARVLAKKMLTSSEFEMASALIKSDGKVPFQTKALWNVFPYSYYAYGMFHGCRLAAALGIKRVSSIEFGVAGGNGLLAMEAHARVIEELVGVSIDVYGFDTGAGLTPPVDYRDMPYRFKKGNYRMDVEKLKGRLERAQLVLGDVRKTARTFLKDYQPAPIAFVSFDMDYYSSTMHAFQMFAAGNKDDFFLPRIFMYFDDVVGNEISCYNDFVGELAAINDFNAGSRDVKIAQNRVFRNYNLNFPWYHQSYVMHRFAHRLYDKYISKASARSLALK